MYQQFIKRHLITIKIINLTLVTIDIGKVRGNFMLASVHVYNRHHWDQ